MATTIITDQGVEHIYVAAAGQTVFPFDFQVFAGATDISVTVGGVPTTNFTIARVGNEGGNLQLGAPALLNQEVILRREMPIERQTQFPSSGPLAIASLNDELNRIVGLIQQINYHLADIGEGITYSDEDAQAAVLSYLQAGNGMTLAVVGGKLQVTATMNNEAVQDLIASTLVMGTGLEATYNDVAGTLTIASTSGGAGGLTTEDVRDTVATALVAGAGISIVHDDVANTITVTAAGASTDEGVQDLVAGMLGAGQGITLLYNDAGNQLTVSQNPVKTLQVPVMAAAMSARAVAGPGATTTETATNKIILPCLDFDPAVAEYAQFLIPMPKQWDEGVIGVQFLWTTTEASGSVMWGARAVAFGDDDALDAAFGNSAFSNDAVTAAGDLMASPFLSLDVAGPPAAEDMVCFEVFRDAVNGADTLAVDARLIGVRLKFGLNEYDDA